MSFLRWGNGGALTDPTSVPAREPSPARNSGKDKFLCPFSSLKKNPHPHPVRKKNPHPPTPALPTSIVVPNSRGEEPTCAYSCLLSRISYSIQTKEEQQPCPKNHPHRCQRNRQPQSHLSSSGGYSPPAPPYISGPDSPKASKPATRIFASASALSQFVPQVFCLPSSWKPSAPGGCDCADNFRRNCI